MYYGIRTLTSLRHTNADHTPPEVVEQPLSLSTRLLPQKKVRHSKEP